MTIQMNRTIAPESSAAKPTRRTVPRIAVLLSLFAVTTVALAQNSDSHQTLIVNGQPSAVPVVQMNGHSYVNLDALARAVGGAISYAGGQTSLTLPGANSAASAIPSPATPPTASSNPAPASGLSKGFLNAGIEEAATLREWHAALGSAIRNGYPITADMLAGYRNQSQTNLRLASAAATTDADRNTYQLLSVVFQNMSRLSDRYVNKRANMEYISPDSLDNDSLDQRIVACGHSLSAIAASGQFYDDGTCH
jgi:hypothetical protein